MNTGERLVALSGLSHVSAFDHFMAIVTGGVNKTVFASQMTVCAESPTTVVVCRCRTSTSGAPERFESPAVTSTNRKKRGDVLLRENRLDILVGDDRLYVVQRQAKTVSTISLNKSVVRNTHGK